jgi:hypothetical protein
MSWATSRSALPPDVRRWLCPADSDHIVLGAMPLVRASPSAPVALKGRTTGQAQHEKGRSTAGHSHRRTSDGKAEPDIANDAWSKADPHVTSWIVR